MRHWIALSALALGACAAETSSPAVADHFEVVQAPAVGTPGRVLDSLILIRVVDDGGRPMAGVVVAWSVVDGGGSVTPVQAKTGQDGVVGAAWRLGIGSEAQSLNISASGVPSIKVEIEARAFRAVAIAQGDGYGCGIDSAGAAWCWGRVSFSASPESQYGPVPQLVDSGHALIGVVAGTYAACAWSSSTTYCWGFGRYLGRGAPEFEYLPSAPISGGHQFTKVVAGNYATCGLDGSGQAWCWGQDNAGNLGDPTVNRQQVLLPNPVVQSGMVFVDLALDWGHSCALEANGRAWCWGYNAFGQLGDSLFTGGETAVPHAVTTDLRFKEIAVGGELSCGADAGKRVWCWGTTRFGTASLPPNSRVPILAPGGSGQRLMMRDQNAGFVRSGRPYFWGSIQMYDYVGPGLASRDPVELPGEVTAITDLAVAYNTICGLRVDGVVLCWGNLPGEDGAYGTTETGTPVAIPAP